MQITFHDRAPISGTHRTADGYLAAEARISRTGIQAYAGYEVGRPDLATVRVFRGEDAVFASDALASIAHKPLTLDHPAGGVTADRWKELAVGWTGDTVARDGEFVRVSMMVADAAAISAIENGTREISCGYTCSLDWTPGITAGGEAFDARQQGLRINHLAIVPKGRAGAAVRIGDSMHTNDIAIADAEIIATVDRQQAAHDQKFAFMGANAPTFDRALAELVARTASRNSSNAAVRDAVREGFHNPHAAPARHVTEPGQDNRAVRDAARSAQYL